MTKPLLFLLSFAGSFFVILFSVDAVYKHLNTDKQIECELSATKFNALKDKGELDKEENFRLYRQYTNECDYAAETRQMMTNTIYLTLFISPIVYLFLARLLAKSNKI